MYLINSKTPYQITLKAKVKQPKEKEEKQVNLTTKYFKIDQKNFSFANLVWELRNTIAIFNKPINIDLDSFLKIIEPKYHEGFIIQTLLNNELVHYYPFDLKNDRKVIKHNYLLNPTTYKKYQKKIKAFTEAFNFGRKLLLMPNNYLNPKKFVQLVLAELKPYQDQLSIIKLNQSQMEKKHMGLILGVGKGSSKVNEPQLLSIKFKNTPADFVIVGKGITFDTGGISLKPQQFLDRMQYDMAGAAIAISIFLVYLKLNLKPKFGIVMPLVANDISADCTKIGDILTSYSKKTVEITNSDAEGRLIMADAMTYAIKDMKAKSVATIATLTGAIIVALGDVYTGYWINNEHINQELVNIANTSGEFIWRMPFNDIYQKRICHSMIADMTNCEVGRWGGAVYAAEFLHAFSENANYLHFDIAGSNDVKVGQFIQPHINLIYTLFNLINDGQKREK